MPARLDQISVTTSRDSVTLPWASRDALLAEIRHLDSAAGIVKAFSDVGATTPVTLSDEDRAGLFEHLEGWSHRVTVARLPPGIWDLRCAIADELHYDPNPAHA